MVPNLEALISALIFAAIFFFGVRLRLPVKGHHRRLCSFGAGVSVAYVFVHLLPDLESVRTVFVRETGGLYLPFRDLEVNLAAMVGFMVYYALENMVTWSKKSGRVGKGKENGSGAVFGIHLGGFALNAGLVTYLRIRSIDEGTVPLALYTVALGLHFLAVDYALFREHGRQYRKWGGKLLAGSALAGWALGSVAELPRPGVIILFGFVAGTVIVNSMVMELPREKKGSFPAFLLGGVVYAALLLILR